MDVDVLGLVSHVPRDVLDPRNIGLVLIAVRAPARLALGVADRGVFEAVGVGLVDNNGVVEPDLDVAESVLIGGGCAFFFLADGAAEDGQRC